MPKRLKYIALLFILTSSFVSFGQNELELKNQKVIEQLSAGQFKPLHKSFSKDFKKSVKAIQLRMIWTGVTKAFGEFDRSGEFEVIEEEGSIIYNTPLYFEEGSLMLKLTFTNDEISGIWLSPQEYQPPPETLGVAYGKERVRIKTDTFDLPGEILIPRTCNQCPLVVLVHGSGPNDMDISIGPNKVFKDIAMLLANEGIATLRYDKRSKVYPALFEKDKPFTINEETVDDALTAVNIAKSFEFVDSSKIFVLGHSLGAYAAPLIASKDQSLAGAIMMAGPDRHISDLLPEQYRYIYGLDGKLSWKEKRKVKRIDKTAAQINSLPNPDVKKLKSAMGYWPLEFFQDLATYRPSEVIRNQQVPFLILQGVQDYQVSYERDFKLLQSRLSDLDYVAFEALPKLDHLMMYSEDFSKPTDYVSPRNVSPEFIKAVTSWILGSD